MNPRRKPNPKRAWPGPDSQGRSGFSHSRPAAKKNPRYQKRTPEVRPEDLVYIVFNKPYEVLTRFTDEQGRATLADFIDIPNVYPVGRLDADSEGLLILTNDGPLSHRLTDPRYEHPKTYLAQVERIPDAEALHKLLVGITLGDGPCRPVEAVCLDGEPVPWERPVPIRFRKTVPTVWLQMTLREGRNRQVRRMCAAIGHPCLRLVRWSLDPVSLDGLEPGTWRHLTDAEVARLKK